MTGRRDGESGHGEQHRDDHENGSHHPYWRFLVMIVTAMVAMYAVTYVNTFELSHVQWSETRMLMTLLMGSTMAVIMLGFMLGMYRNRKMNVSIMMGAIVLFGVATWPVRSQVTVEDRSYMSAMVPHHSIAILTSERSDIEDVRVCELAVAITEAQRHEIGEMNWLIEDIEANGPAETSSAANQRPVPAFEGSSERNCG